MGNTTELDAAVATIRYIRENDCDFLTVETLQAYGHDADVARAALRQEMYAEWSRQAFVGTAAVTESFAGDLGWDWIPGQITVSLPNEPRPPFGRELGRLLAVSRGRRWTRVFEYLSNGQLTARWFVDESTGEARMADSAKKPKRWAMDREAQEFARLIVTAANERRERDAAASGDWKCTAGPNASSGERCGKPAVRVFTSSTGETLAECAEHAR